MARSVDRFYYQSLWLTSLDRKQLSILNAKYISIFNYFNKHRSPSCESVFFLKIYCQKLSVRAVEKDRKSKLLWLCICEKIAKASTQVSILAEILTYVYNQNLFTRLTNKIWSIGSVRYGNSSYLYRLGNYGDRNYRSCVVDSWEAIGAEPTQTQTTQALLKYQAELFWIELAIAMHVKLRSKLRDSLREWCSINYAI